MVKPKIAGADLTDKELKEWEDKISSAFCHECGDSGYSLKTGYRCHAKARCEESAKKNK